MRVELSLHQELMTNTIWLRHPRPGRSDDFGDRIVVFNGGHIEQVGTLTLELYNRPGNLFRAGGFLGSPKMNFLAGEVVSAAAEYIELKLAGGAVLRAWSMAARCQRVRR